MASLENKNQTFMVPTVAKIAGVFNLTVTSISSNACKPHFLHDTSTITRLQQAFKRRRENGQKAGTKADNTGKSKDKENDEALIEIRHAS